jgi:hypothetical protein
MDTGLATSDRGGSDTRWARLVPYVFFADEPPVIHLMSAVALVLGGLSVVVTAS